MNERSRLVGANLRAAREAVGLSQEDLSRILGIDRRVISRWERGQTEPGYYWLSRIATELDAPWTDFYRQTEAAA